MNNEEIKEEVKCEKKEEKKKEHKKENKETLKLQEEKMLLNDKLLRISAEMQNMKKRFEDDLAKSYKYGGEDVIVKMLPIIDNFERAIKLDDSNLSDELSKFLEGFKMIYGNLVNILNSLDVKEIDCYKKEFDPSCMEAVLTSHEEGIAPGIVIDIMQKGYTYKDKVIRVAMVKVSE